MIAVGSGKALKLGENGDVDVLFVHAPEDEEKFVAAGFGVDRKAVMHNDFVLVGPKSDSEKIKSAAGIVEVLYQDKVELVIVSEGSEPLLKSYHLIDISPKIHPHSKYALAKNYIDYVTGDESQKIIANFKKDGQPLFHSDALN